MAERVRVTPGAHDADPVRLVRLAFIVVLRVAAFDHLPYLKTHTRVHMVSSYDRTGANADGSASALDRNPQTDGFVVLDERRPGTIYRIWATALQGGTIRLYFDGEAGPRVDLPVATFFSGAHSPFLFPLVGDQTVSSGGWYSYYPFSFATSIRVEVAAVPNYYQITYHLYDGPDGVTTYTGAEDLAAACAAWMSFTPGGHTTRSAPSPTRRPGRSG